MLRLTELKLPLDHTQNDLKAAVLKRLRIAAQDLIDFTVFRRATDARKKSNITLTYTLDIDVRNEGAVLARLTRDRNISRTPDLRYRFVARAPDRSSERSERGA